MNVRTLLRRSETIVGLAHDARKLSAMPRHLQQLRRRRILVADYLQTHTVRKLHLGAGRARLEGWLDTDLNPAAPQVAFLDATQPFPLPDASFDYVFSEHMIEHLAWSGGQAMLRECFRVLRPGGRVRVGTPDLEVFIGLYGHEGDPPRGRYVHWATERYAHGPGSAGEATGDHASIVINNVFRSFGHQFLYDGELLAAALRVAGFTDIRRWSPGESDDVHLRAIESHGAVVHDAEMAAFETMVFEAARPA